MRAADQRELALSGGDARERDAHRVDAGRLLAHEGARGAGDAVHDRNVAGEQVGELRQEQRRPQVAHQPFVEEGAGIGGLGLPVRIVPSTATSRSPPPAATIMSMRAEQLGVALDAGVREREPGRIGADPLPRLHLALVALLRDLLVEIERRERMDEIGREGLGIDLDRRLARGLANARRAPSPRQETMPMPVIQASRGASAMGQRPHREFEDRGHLLHAGAELGVRKLDQPERDLGVAGELAVAPDLGLGDRVARAFVQQLGRERKSSGRASRTSAASLPSPRRGTACA